MKGITPPAKPARRLLRLTAAILGGLMVGIVVFTVYWFFRIQGIGDTFIIDPDQGATLSLADGAQLTLPPDGLQGPLELRIRAIPATQLPPKDPDYDRVLAFAMTQLPLHRRLHGMVYRFEVEGSPPSAVLFSLPNVADAFYALDLYAWDGTAWRWLPTRLDPGPGGRMAQLESLPLALALMQSEPEVPIITAELAPGMTLRAEAEGVLTELLVTGFNSQLDGSIEANPVLPDRGSTAGLIPSLRNWRDDGTFTADIGKILADPASRQRHLDFIVGLALTGGYPAVQLDYRGLSPVHRRVLSAFVADLATALHEQDRALLIRVEAPVQVATTRWETGAYDWSSIGQVADRLQVPLPTDPNELAQGQAAAQLIWAVGQVDRHKLQAVVSLHSLDASARSVMTLSITQALAKLGPLRSTADDSIKPGEQVSLYLASLTKGVLEVDPVTGMLHFEGPDEQGETHQFYLHTNTSLSSWLQRVARYNLAGVVLEDMRDESIGDQTWEALQVYRTLALPSVESKLVWVWTITKVDTPAATPNMQTRPLAETSYDWTAPDTPGEYRIDVALSTDGGASALPVASLAVRVIPAEPTSATGETDRPSVTPALAPLPASPAPPLPPSSTYQLAYTKWDGRFHNLYIADSRTNTTQLIFTRAAGPSFSADKRRLFFIGEQGITQQIREDRIACDFGTISDGLVAVDLPLPLRDICQVQSGPWLCERKTVDLQSEPSDVCTANGISIYQNLDWKEGTARWASTAPNGDAVAFDAKPSGGYRIYFRAMLGTSQQFRFEIPGEQGSWAPDSQRMVYRSGRDNKAGLWISNRDDSNPLRITENGADSFPAWSPDGKTIAFSRDINGNMDIYVVNVDGSNLQRLTDAPGHDTLPVYTPNGEIIFRSDRTNSWGIWRMGSDGRRQEEIILNAPVGPDWAYSRMDVK